MYSFPAVIHHCYMADDSQQGEVSFEGVIVSARSGLWSARFLQPSGIIALPGEVANMQ
jgi:hypothetical protein